VAHLLLAGYLGCGNLGDDAMMLGFLHGLGGGHDVTVLSGNPEETYRLYGLPSVPRRDMGAVKQAIYTCDALVFPGGSVFQDVTSLKSVGYYSQLVRLAKAAKKPVAMVGQGVGPLNRYFGKQMAVGAFNAADAIVVRDPGSAALLRQLGVKTPVRVAADPVFLLPKPAEREDQTSFQVGEMRTVGLAPRPLGKRTKDVAQLFADLARLLFQGNFMPVLIEMDREEDGDLIQQINKLQGGKVPDLRKVQTPMQLQQRIARMDSVIAMRLHAGVLATTVGVPPFMVSYDPKVTAFANLLDVATAPSIEGLTAQRLFENFAMFAKERERVLKVLERRTGELRQQAELNVEAVVECLRGAPGS
jgi:polysaccharide pyruvyl transferase CsaB